VLSDSLTLSTVVTGVGVEVLLAVGSTPAIGSILLGLQFVKHSLVLLAALMGSSVLVGQGSVADIAVMSAGVDVLEAVVGVCREDVGHFDRRVKCCR
jgi:hypothetical protein